MLFCVYEFLGLKGTILNIVLNMNIAHLLVKDTRECEWDV